jgi:hypothetical protein
LRSGGEIIVFGEPNSLDYKSPEEGVKAELTRKDCESSQREIKPALVGRLNGTKGSLSCGEHLVVLYLAFRAQGGPMYWLRLDTIPAHKSVEETILDRIAASFKLIGWK